ncbi:SDR family NAD(P)-dependent oxidoreductase [Methylobacterium aquaticum]|jgi:3-oxoacyl-[acyl-carrier protein] reductase|uniref:Short-chain dehydrogenase n=1 Tax=Methylobacterium aquaticum TaxID=270351 RepID=A0A0J6VCS8_9HYPH|nr:SDR family NAD(P)-dependent oxidoreductase [Methylobacterium aquaticum]KMO36871.1 short-chain dehydrogenase [Methylobacterium aquaticum]
MDIRFDGRVALISGAAQGIGKAMAAAFHGAGARVHLVDRDTRVVEIGDELGLPAHAVDLSDREAAHGLVRSIVAAEGRLDVLALAAGGVAGLAGTPLEAISDEGWDRLMAANVKSALWLAQAAAPAMTQAGWGRIVVVSSGAGLRASLTGLHGYTAAKHAVNGLVKQLSVGLAAAGVTVNAVAPGFILSNPDSQRQWDGWSAEKKAQVLAGLNTGRLGTAEDIAHAVVFLASVQASWITGQVISVDGGRS